MMTLIPATAIAAATSSSPIRLLTCRVLELLLCFLGKVVEVEDAVACGAVAVHAAILPDSQGAIHNLHPAPFFVFHAPSGMLPVAKTLMLSI